MSKIVAYPPFSGYNATGAGGGGTGLLGSIAQFSDTTDQTLVAGTPLVVSFNTTDYASGGIGVVAGTQLTVSNAGVYRFDISLQMLNSGGGGSIITIWPRINGTNVPNSASSIEMGNNNNRTLPYVPILLPMLAAQYVEWVVLATGVNTSIEHFPAVVGPPAVPAVPSVIAGVYRLA
jgi:hypothetical protein